MFQKMYGQVTVKTKIIENVCRTFTLLNITTDQDSHNLTLSWRIAVLLYDT
jgi:hypothetical protein